MDLENGGTKKTPFGEKTYLTFLWEVFFFFFSDGLFLREDMGHLWEHWWFCSFVWKSLSHFRTLSRRRDFKKFLIHRHSILMKLSTVFFGITPASPSRRLWLTILTFLFFFRQNDSEVRQCPNWLAWWLFRMEAGDTSKEVLFFLAGKQTWH